MKLTALISTALFLTAGVVMGQKTVPVKSTWTTSPTATTSTEQGGAAPGEVYLENAKIHLVATNNAEKLFLTIQLDNDQDQFKSLLFGSTIWLDQKGKRKNWRGIQFPLPEELDPATGRPLSMGTKAGPTDKATMMKSMIDRKIEMKLIRLVADDEMLVPATRDPSGITGHLEEKAGRLVYQLTIPLALINAKPGSDTPLAIGFETGVPERPKQSMSNSSNMGNGGMGGMGYGGGMYGRRGGMGYGGGGGGSFSGPTMSPTRFSITVELAAQ
ncbi:hypothetical protein GCM10028803_05530 [Larkinella knui]|uniref:hypothetical protein n=1 Tax=Larkinella knui TaxID=2025310 RepID=UPI00163AE257|nr:hypothetical protein [Larkinella knui]